MKTAFAAPRGICNGTMNGEAVLFIADSESSSIRVVTLKDGNVSHLIGGDADSKVRRNERRKSLRFCFLLVESESFGVW